MISPGSEMECVLQSIRSTDGRMMEEGENSRIEALPKKNQVFLGFLPYSGNRSGFYFEEGTVLVVELI